MKLRTLEGRIARNINSFGKILTLITIIGLSIAILFAYITNNIEHLLD
jgi:hypothetical protein